MTKVQSPKGTYDILPQSTQGQPWQQSHVWQELEARCRHMAALYNYAEVRTPIYERTELFDRGVGETSDIVSKEMFTFLDRGERSMSLRPEGTSSVMRAFLEGGLPQLGTMHKLFYIGPMFRYERPQSGRYRQHHQFGVEAIGSPLPEQDAEVIELLVRLYQGLGLKEIEVHLNSVGDLESRAHYRTALVNYLQPKRHALSEDSQVRLEKNPLRILDSKDPTDKEIIAEAPSILHYLTPAAKHHFDALCDLLKTIKVPFKIDDKIVRGLDYYNKTVFEVVTTSLGAQGTIGAGGRYDGLLATFGGPDLPAVGFGTGLERILQLMQEQQCLFAPKEGPLVYFIPLGDSARSICFDLTTQCRHHNLSSDIELSAKKIGVALHNAERIKARFAVILGEDEIKTQTVQLKELKTRAALSIPQELLMERLRHASHSK